MKLPRILTQDFLYELPEDRIAVYPLPQRDLAKLMVFERGELSHHVFSELPDLLPDNSVLFFNDTRVIQARFQFEKQTGAEIEVFVLHPVAPSPLLSISLAATKTTTWKCTVGNLKRWTKGLVLEKTIGPVRLFANLIDPQTCVVEFSWSPPQLSFAEVLQVAGAVPLPPYLKRAAEPSDLGRYQTVYSHYEGAVAAPTAGLHFTEETLRRIQKKKIIIDFLTLHVSAGTFLPVKTEDAAEHPMHEEQIIVYRRNVETLLLPGKKTIAVGTTSMRTLESLYWYGASLITDPASPFKVEKMLPYQYSQPIPTVSDALHAILERMDQEGVNELTGKTSIYILPGYRFKICQGLITNFHQPGSSLLLLIAAFIGPDWRKMYDEGLARAYRFLSYGDSSLLLP